MNLIVFFGPSNFVFCNMQPYLGLWLIPCTLLSKHCMPQFLPTLIGHNYLPLVKTVHFHIIPRRSRRDIVLAASVRPFRPSVHFFCLSGTISQYLLVRFDSFLVQMISTMNFRYPSTLVKIDPLTLELLPLF